VRASALNRADVMQREGQYPAPPGSPKDIPGLEFAGEVEAVGEGVFGLKVGQRVFGLAGGGGQAEYIVSHERLLVPIPDNLDFVQAAAVPEAFITASDALFTQAGLRAGERLLVHGAAGGVGTAGLQLGVAAGAQVTASVRNPKLRDQVAMLGAHAVIEPAGFADHGPFDVILELVGAPNLADNLRALETNGRIVVIGIGAGANGELNLGALMGKRATLRGSTLRPRPLEEKALTARALERHVLPLFERGAVRVPIAATYPLDAVDEAYARFSAGGKLGKIVLTMS
jgi:NADPH:quinone reductase-like Zn-dependent oxidoreductase